MKNFDRFKLLIGNEQFNYLENKTILIVGIGGVGGYTLESLVRSGIKNIIIIDHDIIDETNLNRQIISLENNINKYKIDVATIRAMDINKNCNIIGIKDFLSDQNIDMLNNYNIDYIIDCCDTINTKINLIKYSKKYNIKLISCMGTGKRLDATKLVITTLNKTFNDPLAKVMRKRLREEQIDLKIPVVASLELAQNINNKEIASCSYVPAVAGLYLTNYVINDIIKSYQFDNLVRIDS